MRYPEFLGDNGTIGFVAPSFGCATEPYFTGFNRAITNFKNRGYNVKIGHNCYKAEGIGISNSPVLCGQELTEEYLSDESQILISCGGGELMCEILEYVDFEKIGHAKPKWFLGYSDNTNFTFLQNTICDTASVYGSCASAFGMEKWYASIEDTFDVITGRGYDIVDGIMMKKISGYPFWEKDSLKTEDNPTPDYNLTETKTLRCYISDAEVDNANFDGRLIGGCVDCLVNILGTKYDNVKAFNERYADEGIVWFLESCDLNVFAIRRAMWQMDNAGWFRNVKGFIIGRPLCFGQEMMGLNQYSAVMGILEKYNVPVVMDCDFGHLSPSMPIISGAYSEIEADRDNINITYKLV